MYSVLQTFLEGKVSEGKVPGETLQKRRKWNCADLCQAVFRFQAAKHHKACEKSLIGTFPVCVADPCAQTYCGALLGGWLFAFSCWGVYKRLLQYRRPIQGHHSRNMLRTNKPLPGPRCSRVLKRIECVSFFFSHPGWKLVCGTAP